MWKAPISLLYDQSQISQFAWTVSLVFMTSQVQGERMNFWDWSTYQIHYIQQ
jgi:hypothetical protein